MMDAILGAILFLIGVVVLSFFFLRRFVKGLKKAADKEDAQDRYQKHLTELEHKEAELE